MEKNKELRGRRETRNEGKEVKKEPKEMSELRKQGNCHRVGTESTKYNLLKQAVRQPNKPRKTRQVRQMEK